MYNFHNPADFEQMYHDYFPKIYNHVFYRLLHKEQTEDVVSNIFLKVSENILRFDSQKASFNTWIFTIAKNTLTDFYRLRRTQISIDDTESSFELHSDSLDEESKLIGEDELRELYKALAALDGRTREVISLKYFGEFKNREIAKQTGINESTVATICLRGLERLRKVFEI
ncbi:MAG: RNA polymerase subunit sigma-24 [Firmicutes bacterium HGW-Firmicutes-15]|nr:MAG: RNA polymerase subunit sigma-24 [Firmicutes bacterium HGW-Firmicutes-15]